MDNQFSSVDLRQKIDGFLRKPAYVLLLMLLTAISFALRTELLVYSVIALVVAYTCIWSEDLLPLMPVFVCAYVAPSTANNPGQTEDSMFSGISGLYVVLLGVIIFSAVIYRIIRDRKQMFRKNGTLLSGLLVLTGAYLISGIGFDGYLQRALMNIPFGLVQGLSLLLPYWLLVGGVDWKKARQDYFAWLGFGLGCVLVAEVVCIYISQGVVVDGVINRPLIYTGWGMYNNLGNLLAMMIPFAFWLGLHYEKPWIGFSGGLLLLIGVFMTCSRSSMIFATLCYSACWIWAPDEDKRIRNSMILAVAAAIVGLLLILFREQLFLVFINILDDASELGSRFDIYQQGIREFLKNPLLGATFYPAKGLSYSWAETSVTAILPPRWHNTIIQLLASAGIVGLAAYAFHRYQTVRLLVKCKSGKQIMLVFSLMVLLLGSLTDCHMFNVGPGLFYSMMLAWMEKKELSSV